MPLLDHFHAPVAPRQRWESFHAAWATEIMRFLNRRLSKRFLAQTFAHLGAQIAADVAEFDSPGSESALVNGPVGGAIVAQVEAPTRTFSIRFSDDFGIEIRDVHDTGRVVSVIELVSPANKDRPESRLAFAGKCAAYLQQGIGLVVIDIVTARHADPHWELLNLLNETAGTSPALELLHAVGYRPVSRGPVCEVEAWVRPLVIGQPLPSVPLSLGQAGLIVLDLESTYSEAREANGL